MSSEWLHDKKHYFYFYDKVKIHKPAFLTVIYNNTLNKIRNTPKLVII